MRWRLGLGQALEAEWEETKYLAGVSAVGGSWNPRAASYRPKNQCLATAQALSLSMYGIREPATIDVVVNVAMGTWT